MAQVIVRELEEVVKQGLKRRAARHGRSMEEEAREILRNAVREEQVPPTRLGSRIAARFRGKGLDTDLPELRGVIVLDTNVLSALMQSQPDTDVVTWLDRKSFLGSPADTSIKTR